MPKISYFDYFTPMFLKTYSQAPIFISELLRSEVLPTDIYHFLIGRFFDTPHLFSQFPD
jgi:hypothetical protein